MNKSNSEAIGAIVITGIIFAMIVMYGPRHCRGTTAQEETEIGETILEEEIVVEQSAPLILVPARTSLLIDYMMGYEESKWYKPMEAVEHTACSMNWGGVIKVQNRDFYIFYCEQIGEELDEIGYYGDYVVVSERWHGEQFANPIHYYAADLLGTVYCRPGRGTAYEQQAETIRITNELIAYYENGH